MRFQNGEEFVKNLVSTYCPTPSISNTISLQTYFKKADNIYYQAVDFVKVGNEPRAYIELMRFSQFIVQLSEHTNYNQKTFEREKNLNKKRLSNAITKMEELKPKIIESYNEEIKKETENKNNEKKPTITLKNNNNNNNDNQDNEDEKKK